MHIDESVCFECGSATQEWHHVIPRSKGGTKMIPLCSCCHSKVHGNLGKRRDNLGALVKAGIAASKARGTLFGSDDPRVAAHAQKRIERSVRATKDEADRFAESMKCIVQPMREEGASINIIADRLNEQFVKTQRGGKWYPKTIANLMDRWK